MIKKITSKIKIRAVEMILKLHVGYFKLILKFMMGIDGKLKTYPKETYREKKDKLRCVSEKEKK